jgi:hypothetical protein
MNLVLVPPATLNAFWSCRHLPRLVRRKTAFPRSARAP